MTTGENISVLLGRLTRLASERQEPLRIYLNPKLIAFQTTREKIKDSDDLSRYIAQIGNAVAYFNGYNFSDLIEVYSSLRAQLAAEEATFRARADALQPGEVNNKSGAV